MKHKVLGYTFIIVALAAAVSVLYYVEMRDVAKAVPALPNHQEPILVQQVYQNTQYGFEISYDTNYELDISGGAANYFNNPGKTIISIAIPQERYPQTNFVAANATVAVQEGSSRGPCEKASAIKTINGTAFHKSGESGAAAGTFWETKIYRAFKNDACYEISLTAGISNFGNFEIGAVTEVDENLVWQKLDAIAETFKFTEYNQSFE